MAIKDYTPEKRKFVHSIIFPSLFIFVLLVIKLIETVNNTNFGFLGVYPRELKGLPGILFFPLIHGNFKHLIDNSLSLFFLATGVFYFYNKVAFKVFFTLYLIPGIMVWIIGRSSYHIGASGLIYGLASFLFFSGIIRQNANLLAISLLVIFLYGSMVWGIFPYRYDISWEGHLAGGLTGFVLSVIYRNIGPPSTVKKWEEDEDENDDDQEMMNDDNAKLKDDLAI